LRCNFCVLWQSRTPVTHTGGGGGGGAGAGAAAAAAGAGAVGAGDEVVAARNSGVGRQGRGGEGGGGRGGGEVEEESMQTTQVIEITSTPGAMCVCAVRACARARMEHRPSLRRSALRHRGVRHSLLYAVHSLFRFAFLHGPASVGGFPPPP